MNTQKDILNLIEKTYSNINRAKQEVDIYSSSNTFKQDIYTIEIALCLFQLGFFANRSIQEIEENWFNGGYYIHYDLDGSYEELANNYSEIVKIVKEHNFFR
jgi:hypothetical protein